MIYSPEDKRRATISPMAFAQELEILRSGPTYAFADWPNSELPKVSAGVYTIWNKTETFVYVGMAGHGKTAADLETAAKKNKVTGMRDRLRSHASGLRSGDQFCIYVADFLVLPNLSIEDITAIHKREIRMDILVKEYVHQNLSYRYCLTEDGAQALALERLLVNGALGNPPFLNPAKSLQ